MYRHILLPTDGSELAERAVSTGLSLAWSLGARATALHVRPTAAMEYDRHGTSRNPDAALHALEHCETELSQHASTILDRVGTLAKCVGVDCELACVQADDVGEAIIAAAEERGCDLVLMGTHARTGLDALVQGSETRKVMTHSKIPILVVR